MKRRKIKCSVLIQLGFGFDTAFLQKVFNQHNYKGLKKLPEL
jgi:hypothetical protein